MGEPDEQQRLNPDCVAAYAKYKDDMKNVTGTLTQRVLEVIEATIVWMQRQANQGDHG